MTLSLSSAMAEALGMVEDTVAMETPMTPCGACVQHGGVAECLQAGDGCRGRRSVRADWDDACGDLVM